MGWPIPLQCSSFQTNENVPPLPPLPSLSHPGWPHQEQVRPRHRLFHGNPLQTHSILTPVNIPSSLLCARFCSSQRQQPMNKSDEFLLLGACIPVVGGADNNPENKCVRWWWWPWRDVVMNSDWDPLEVGGQGRLPWADGMTESTNRSQSCRI